MSDDLQLRRATAAQFTILYAYFKPNAALPGGLVSVRAPPGPGVFSGGGAAGPYEDSYQT